MISAIDLRQHFVNLFCLALLLPQASKARGSTASRISFSWEHVTIDERPHHILEWQHLDRSILEARRAKIHRVTFLDLLCLIEFLERRAKITFLYGR